LEDGDIVLERNGYWSAELGRECATNWHEVPKDKVDALALLWKGRIVAFIERSPETVSWVFSHTGSMDTSGSVKILSRNIGCSKGASKDWIRVFEDTGHSFTLIENV
jgi:hypothetical protein